MQACGNGINHCQQNCERVCFNALATAWMNTVYVKFCVRLRAVLACNKDITPCCEEFVTSVLVCNDAVAVHDAHCDD